MSYSNLNSYKDEFILKFAQIMQENLEEWEKVQKKHRKDIISPGSFAFYFFAAICAFLPGKHERHYDLNTHIVMAVIFFIVAVVINIGVNNKFYQDSVKSTLFPALLKIFGNNIRYGMDSYADFLAEHHLAKNPKELSSYIGNIKYKIFNESKLFERYKFKVNHRYDDDYFWGIYNDVLFQINELKIGYYNSEARKSNELEFFNGIAMHFLLNKNINSRVIIVSKGSKIKLPENYNKVELEYEKFNKKYNVWVENLTNGEIDTDSQIEARYLLNTAFIDRFMQLQTSFKVNKIQSSIYGNSMLILLETRRDLFEMNHLLGKIDDINQYKNLFDEFTSVLSFIDILNIKSTSKL